MLVCPLFSSFTCLKLFVSAVLSGKQLFTYNSSLFVDDDGAVDQTDEEEYQREQKLREDREEAMARAAAARAQEEQDRLLELHR